MINRAVINQVWSAIRTRVAVPAEDRNPYFLCIDELDKIVTPEFSVNDIISLARSHKLGVITSFQQFSQLPDDTKDILSAASLQVSLNPGNNTSEAGYVGQIHDVGANRMKDLDKNEAVFNPVTEQGFRSEIAFDIELFADIPPKRESVASIVENSREKYAVRQDEE